MKLPNDLIKSTDYSKAKDREIHEFEYRNGKYIHKYVLGGEHELTPQEIVDCLNAISTIDCDLQTAYAFIQSQKDKINSLENGIVDDETLNTLVKEHKLYKDLEAKLAESEKKAYSRGHSQRDIDNEIKLNALREDIANKEKRIIELKQQLEEKDAEINVYKKYIKVEDQDKILFAVEQLKETQIYVDNQHFMNARYKCEKKVYADIWNFIDNQIKQLKEQNDV